MTRKDIFNEINRERTRQETELWGPEVDDKNTVNDWIAYITAYAGEGYAHPSDGVKFRQAMVKVAALAIAAIEAGERNSGYPPCSNDPLTSEGFGKEGF